MRIICEKFQRPNLKFAIIHFVITQRTYSRHRLCRIHHFRRRRGCEVSHYEYASFGDAIHTSGELASELGISSQPWLSKALLKSADGVGLHRADIAQEAQVAVAALQASVQGEGCPGMNTTYTVKHIQKGLTLLYYYNKWEINYILFGKISKLCHICRIQMEAMIAAHKIVAKPIIQTFSEEEYEWEYTHGVREWARIGRNMDGSLPQTLPNVDEKYSSCKSCDKKLEGWSNGFLTTWP